jgi:hypothetical protein
LSLEIGSVCYKALLPRPQYIFAVFLAVANKQILILAQQLIVQLEATDYAFGERIALHNQAAEFRVADLANTT